MKLKIMETNVTTMLQYKVKNEFNSEVIKAAQSVVFRAEFDSFRNVLQYWISILSDMIALDTNNVEINKDYIDDANEDNRKMIYYIYNK